MKNTDDAFPLDPNSPWAQRDPEWVLDRLRRSIKIIGREHDKQDERLESLKDFLARVEYLRQEAGAHTAIREEIWQEVARQGVDVTIRRDTRGRAWVTFYCSGLDKSWVVRLTPAMADILEALCGESGPSGDHLVGWKSIDNLAESLKDRFGNRLETPAAIVRVARLRKALEDAGVSSQLVQRDHNRYRFARKSAAVSEIHEIPGNTD